MSDEKCSGCGSDIEYSADVQSLKCPYCGAVNEIARPEEALPDEIDAIVPLAVPADRLERKAYDYMASGNYTPDDMLDAAVFTKKEMMYVPAYIFNVDFEATWTASFGYDRKETYTEYQTVYRDGKSRKEPVTRTKTVTDWRPQHGTDTGSVWLATYAGQRLSSSTLSLRELVRHGAQSKSITAFNRSFLKGVEVEPISVSESSAYAQLDSDLNAKIENSVQRHAQGDRQRDWHWKASTQHQTTTVYVPICHIAFDYKGVEYHLWTDGVSGNHVVADSLPEDTDKMRQVKQGFIPLAIGAAAFVVSTFFWTFTWVSLAAVAAAGMYGFLRRSALIEHSQKIRGSLLTQKKASSTSEALSDDEQAAVAKAFTLPEKTFFARTHQDRKMLPALSVAAILAAALPAYDADHAGTRAEAPQELLEAALPATEVAQDAQVAADVSQEPPAVDQADSSSEEPAVAGEAEWRPSFDCTKASASVETMICASQELSALDVEMSDAFKASATKDIRQTQVEWRTMVRDACQDESCVANAYRDRIDQIKRAAEEKVAQQTSQDDATPAGVNSTAIAKMLKLAESELEQGNFDSASTTAKNVLTFDPQNQRAKSVLEAAARSKGPRW